MHRRLFLAAAIVVGAVFLATAVFRPPFLWNMGKVATGRALAGDTAVAVLFGALGVLLPLAGLAVFVKGRRM